jgi:ClpP class serine protease
MLLNEILMLEPLSARALVNKLNMFNGFMPPETKPEEQKPLEQKGAIVIPVHGVLAKNPDYYEVGYYGAVDVDKKADQILQASSQTKEIILDWNSPGGSCLAVDPLRAAIQLVQDAGVRVTNYTSGQRTSAALYASVDAKRHIATPNGLEGSIGTYVMILDVTEFDKEMGLKYQLFASSDLKAAGNPHVKLTDKQKVYFEEFVANVNEGFVTAVQQGFKLGDSKAWATGATFTAKQALELGIIQGIDTMHNVVSKTLKSAKTKGLKMELEQLLTMLGLPATATLEDVRKHLEQKSNTAVGNDREVIATLLGFESGAKMTNDVLSQTAQQITEGKAYRASLVKQGEELHVKVYGQEKATARFENSIFALENAPIAKLEAARDALQADFDTGIPNAQLSKDGDEKKKYTFNTRYLRS